MTDRHKITRLRLPQQWKKVNLQLSPDDVDQLRNEFACQSSPLFSERLAARVQAELGTPVAVGQCRTTGRQIWLIVAIADGYAYGISDPMRWPKVEGSNLRVMDQQVRLVEEWDEVAPPAWAEEMLDALKNAPVFGSS